ncbi:hypothetical protein [Xylanibacter rarus]|jgi:hypothetical protein|uniref:Uncharacterized protein n=1 Tax=Xylanibacter rarus TaxID=1676614 RepID=A0A8E1QVX8_9BACT|nr:hypothetical protein [Xylanibacter rarus]KOO66058.1 hypothetical protein ACU52_13975 [Xylanibacter rarus]
MNTIKMGNDEFILYCRKNGHGINKTTDQLGRLIWEWIRDKANGRQIENNKECLWGQNANNVSPTGLPYTATQFEFDRNKLPDLYDYLDTL